MFQMKQFQIDCSFRGSFPSNHNHLQFVGHKAKVLIVPAKAPCLPGKVD